jgi:hypothetical protein
MIVYFLREAFLKKTDSKEILSPALEGIKIDIILLCFLIIATIKLTYSIETILDIALDDESFYLRNGARLIKYGLQAAQYSPLYTIWYYLLSLLEKNNIQLYYLNYKVLISSTTIALYLYLRRIRVAPAISAVASFLYLISAGNSILPWISHFALLVLFLFLIIATFAKSKGSYYCIVGIGLLMVSLVRPEYFISFILIFLIFLFFILRKFKTGIKPRPDLLRLFFFLLITQGLFYIFGNPLSGNRSWLTFGQHFSRNFVSWNNIPINGFINWEQIVKSVFGDANTIIGAAISNSREFLRHVLYNAVHYIPASLAILLVGFQNFMPQSADSLIRCSEFLFLLALSLYLFKKKSEVTKTANRETINRLRILILVLSVPILLSVLIMYPRMHYLIIQEALVIVALSYFISNAFEDNAKVKQAGQLRSFMLGLLILGLTPNLVSGWFFMPNELAKRQNTNRATLQNLNTLEFINSLKITEKVNLLEEGVRYIAFLGDNYKSIPDFYKKEPFNNFIRNYRINMIVLDENLEQDKRFVDDNEFKAFLENPQLLGFIKLSIPHTRKYLFVKDKLL